MKDRGVYWWTALGTPVLVSVGALSLWAGAVRVSGAPGDAGEPVAGPARGADPSTVVGPGECSECHTREYEVWKLSAHSAGSKTLTRSPETRRIAKALGIRRVKREDRCVSCHYTGQLEDTGVVAPIAGVSCESCHGGAREWLTVHYDYGPGGADRATETPEHRAGRLGTADAMGMHRPETITGLAESCYACHVVDDPELVNVGGHPAGEGFELVAWSQGSVRHNFFRDGEDHNIVSSPERLRVLYIAGQAYRLDAALRALAVDGADGAYRDAMTAMVSSSLEALALVDDVVDLGGLGARAREIREAGVESLDADGLRALAIALDGAIERFIQGAEGQDFSALDPLIPTAYYGEPVGE